MMFDKISRGDLSANLMRPEVFDLRFNGLGGGCRRVSHCFHSLAGFHPIYPLMRLAKLAGTQDGYKMVDFNKPTNSLSTFAEA